jgi:hypothetical protein
VPEEGELFGVLPLKTPTESEARNSEKLNIIAFPNSILNIIANNKLGSKQGY